MHQPVLLNEVLEYLDPRPGQFIIDGTVDGGGHASAIIEKIGPKGKFLGLDLDERLIRETEKRISSSNLQSQISNLFFRHANYADLPEILEREKLPLADRLFLDLGFSSDQLEGSGRGFSFQESKADEPLLMTYDDSRTPVRELLKKISEKELADIIFEFGGERQSRRIAKAIVEQARKKAMSTSGELAETVRSALPHGYERGRIDPATRTFQALRIYANGELENLSNILEQLNMILKPGGRAVIISFHSLEDRIVKQHFQKMQKEKIAAEILTKKPVMATREEIAQNPRARSAKLRAIQLT
jgi:16S rRNA (cytosine1402-N4)-methyltransferase